MRYLLRSIDQREFNVSLPSLADLDFYDFPSGILDLLHDCSIIRCIEEQEALARMFLKKIRICLLLESPAQWHSGSSFRPSGFDSPFNSRPSLRARAEVDIPGPSVLAESYLGNGTN